MTTSTSTSSSASFRVATPASLSTRNPNHANSFHPKEVIGLLFAKELVLVDPEDCLPVRTICYHWFGRDVPIFYSDSKLTTVMNEFKSGRSHMALVKEVVDNTDGDPFYSTVAPPTNNT